MKAPKMHTLKSKETPTPMTSHEFDPRPTLHMSTEELPAIKGWEAGKEYSLHIKVKMEQKNTQEKEGEKAKTKSVLRITKIAAIK